MNDRPDDTAGPAGTALAERVIRLGRALQARGVDVALAEVLDAERAASLIDLADRDQLRVALRSTLVKSPRHADVFEAAFERLFPARPAGTAASDGAPADPIAVLTEGGDLGVLAAGLVEEHAGLDGEQRSEGHHLQRAWRGADLAKLMSDARRADPSIPAEELRSRIEELKSLMAAEVRAHLGEPDDIGFDQQLEDVEFLNASRVELEAMRAAIRPLARRIASRLARRRQRQRSGRVNMRRTARKSVGTGGVPVDVVNERPRAHRPELFVLCDVSGSVAEFSLFTLTLMAALSAEVSRTRSFVFADGIDEVTELLERTEHGIEPWQLMRNTNVVRDDGHSDYGSVLQQFWDETGSADLRSSSTVLVTGDARSNHREPLDAVLGQIAGRCRRVYWLNPEPRDEWDTHDSVMERYATHCSDVFEVRTLRQLAAAVEEVL